MSDIFRAGLYRCTCPKCGGEGQVESGKSGRLKKCSKCEGGGTVEVYVDECGECGGEKIVECDCRGGLGKEAADDDCYACGGDGYHSCPACDGRGFDKDCLTDAGISLSDFRDY